MSEAEDPIFIFNDPYLGCGGALGGGISGTTLGAWGTDQLLSHNPFNMDLVSHIYNNIFSHIAVDASVGGAVGLIAAIAVPFALFYFATKREEAGKRRISVPKIRRTRS